MLVAPSALPVGGAVRVPRARRASLEKPLRISVRRRWGEQKMGSERRYVAVDLHRKNMYVVIQDEEGREVLRRSFEHSAQGEAELRAQLRPEDQVVLEATTGAHRLACRLESTGAAVSIADPQRARLVGFRGKKTDYRDCLALLELLRSGYLVTVWRPDARTREIRQLTRERQGYNKAITQFKNRVRAVLADEGLTAPSNLWEPAGTAWLEAQTLSPAAAAV